MAASQLIIDVDEAIVARDKLKVRACLNCRNAKVTHVDDVLGPMVVCSKDRWPESYRLGKVLMGKMGAMRHKGECPDWTE